MDDFHFYLELSRYITILLSIFTVCFNYYIMFFYYDMLVIDMYTAYRPNSSHVKHTDGVVFKQALLDILITDIVKVNFSMSNPTKIFHELKKIDALLTFLFDYIWLLKTSER